VHCSKIDARAERFLGFRVAAALPSIAAWALAAALPFLAAAAPRPAAAQESGSLRAPQPAAVLNVVRWTGSLPEAAGRTIQVQFAIFEDQAGGLALWRETQTVEIGADGRYSVLLGATSAEGMPAALFQAGVARWIEATAADVPNGKAAAGRSLLAAVPYALKSIDAEMLAGRSASDYVTREELESTAAGRATEAHPSTSPGPVTGAGTSGYVPLWTGASTLANSVITVSGKNVGIGTTAPVYPLDVNGTETLRGGLKLETNGAATPTAGVNSSSIEFQTNSYSSAAKAPVQQYFIWQADSAGNNTASPTANLVLSTSSGSATPKPTGFSFGPTGLLNFAPGQTFPGTGAGTITGVTAGTALTGGGTNGSITLNLDTTKVPLLGANNTFSGSLSTTGAVNASTYDLNGALFAYGNRNGNSFVGFAGNGSVPTSIDNTADGYEAMTGLTGGGSNTAVGANALDTITTGDLNTALGAFSGATYSNLIDSTAIGANAFVSQNDSLVLGQTANGSPGKTYVSVGIGTATPASELELSESASDALGPVLTLTNPAGDGASAAIDFKTYLHASTANSPTARIWAVDDNYGTDLLFLSKEPGSDFNPLQTNMAIFANGQVTMGTLSQLVVYEGQTRDAQLSVQGNNGLNGIVAVGGAPVSGSTDGGDGGIFGGGNNEDGVWGISGGGYGGFFQGDVFVNGTLQASTKQFKIDHPSDPGNKYLVHSSVESSEMMNIYSGNVVTDKLGLATVTLPEWFEVENGDYRYQLTTIGRDAHAWIAEEVAHNQFKIATNATFVKVSWQITAVRQDAYAKAHPLVVEAAKPERERGYYIHPELYGQPEEKQIAWARNPKVMQQIKARREAGMKARAQAQK
jgi:hypothetical protein